MRTWHFVPLLAKLKLVYHRLTLSKIIIAYFVLALLHCMSQIAWQASALGLENDESAILYDIISAGNVTAQFADLHSDESIELCHAIPGQTSDPHPCQTFTGASPKSLLNASILAAHPLFGDDPGARPHESRRGAFKLSPRDAVLTGIIASDGKIRGVNITGIPGFPPMILTQACTQVIAWPNQIINQAKREAIATIVFQIWLFGVSIVAVLQESIPHILAALATHVLSTAWASFQIVRNEHFESRFTNIVTNGACAGIDLLPHYWDNKLNLQIPILVFNGASLLVSGFLSYKLSVQYGLQTFNRVGVSRIMHHIYLLVLVLSASLQLTAFFLLTSIILWVEQLVNGPIAPLTELRTTYLGVFITSGAFVIPWLFIGLTAVRRECRKSMIIFLIISLHFIASHTGMFTSPVYRLTFSTWTYFGTLTVVAHILVVATFVMAIVCRTLFGRGLAHFLHVQDALEECDFTPVYFERDDPETAKKHGPRDEKWAAECPTLHIRFLDQRMQALQPSLVPDGDAPSPDGHRAGGHDSVRDADSTASPTRSGPASTPKRESLPPSVRPVGLPPSVHPQRPPGLAIVIPNDPPQVPAKVYVP